jgi:hypothetical protein
MGEAKRRKKDQGPVGRELKLMTAAEFVEGSPRDPFALDRIEPARIPLIAATLAVAADRPGIIQTGIEPGGVIYLALENPTEVRIGLRSASVRLRVDLAALGGRILIIEGEATPDAIRAALMPAAEAQPIKLIVVDTIGKLMKFNEVADAQAFARRLRSWTELYGTPTLILAGPRTETSGSMFGDAVDGEVLLPPPLPPWTPRKNRKAARRYLEDSEAVSTAAIAVDFLPRSGALIDMAETLARKTLVGAPNEQLSQTWLLQRDDEDSVMVVETPWSDDHSKLAIFDYIRGLARKNNVSSYAFVCEAWMADADTDVRPRDSDTRIEIVIAVVADGKSKTSKSWSIIRNDDGVCVELKFRDQDQDIGVNGRIAKLLDEP